MGPVKIVVAVAKNGIIGADMDMPWKLSSDLKRFKAITMGQPIIMGRKTFESIGRPLPGRTNIVITRDGKWQHKDVQTAGSLEEALRIGGESEGADMGICIVGGGQIYALAMEKAADIGLNELHVTHVEAKPEGDTIFPQIDEQIWKKVSQEVVPASEMDSVATNYAIYRRN